MTKRQVALGTLVILVLSVCLIGSMARMSSAGYLLLPTPLLDPAAAGILFWILVGLSIYGFLLGILIALGKTGRIFPAPQVRIIPLLPVP